ncbi:MAG: hypothetical protein ACI4O5_06850 [Oscillospiraceae bacterium]
MMEPVSVLNHSMDLGECRDKWTFDAPRNCWCLEDILYTEKADVPKFQRLSIFVPKAYLNGDGTVNEAGTVGGYTARTVPVVFENNSAGYMQMPHVWLDGPRCYAKQYLDHGLVYVSCGCRGRESRNAQGELVGKAPASLVDLKTALRFLRHNRSVLPGDWDKIISVGWSAGGAMSSLLAVSGDNERFVPYLKENGAFLEESDRVYAAQIYCPIVDLEHADQAYEWMFRADKTCEDSPAGPAETMTPFKEALSRELADQYIAYFNGLGLVDPDNGQRLTLGADGRSGSAYDYLMACLDRSATDFLHRLSAETLSQSYSVSDYLAGNYTFEAPAPAPGPGKDPGSHHAGPGEALPDLPQPPGAPPSLGDLVSRPPKGVPFRGFTPPMQTCRGAGKSAWLTWDGEKASVSGLDDYVLNHRRRMKPCTAFDKLEMDSGENQAFGSPERDYVHFNPAIAAALEQLKDRFPEEYDRYHAAFAAAADDPALAERVALTNPLTFIGTDEKSFQAQHYRIRVGASDADTALSVSMTLALKLANAWCGTVDYAMVWDQPHSEADYPGEVLAWIDQICK